MPSWSRTYANMRASMSTRMPAGMTDEHSDAHILSIVTRAKQHSLN
jgi:hypothetical protein